MSLNPPLIDYKSIKINDKDVLLGDECKASFSSPYNLIEIRLSSLNYSISYYEIRVTKDGDEYDIGVGNRIYWTSNLETDKIYYIPLSVNEENFNQGDGVYRISLYARNALDGSWDVTYIFCTIANDMFTLADGSSFDVLTVRDTP